MRKVKWVLQLSAAAADDLVNIPSHVGNYDQRGLNRIAFFFSQVGDDDRWVPKVLVEEGRHIRYPAV